MTASSTLLNVGGVGGVGSLLLVLNIISELVKTNLLGNSFSSGSVLGSRLVVEDSIDFFEGQTLELFIVSK
jgi:hypothetical protein